MALPQQQQFTRGQILDRSRSRFRSRCYPARITKWTLTVALAETGTFSFKIVGPGGPFTISYDATVAPDTNDSIAASLKTKVEQNLKAYKLVRPSVSGAVLTLDARVPGVEFEITDATAPGAATLTPADATPTKGELNLGIAVALVDSDPDSIRVLGGADTAARVFGILAEEPADMKPNNGEYDQDDVYEEDSRPTILEQGEIPVIVEEAIAIGDDVYVRKTAAGTEILGAFRTDADGGDAVQLTNAKWTSASYSDAQGRLTAMLNFNSP